MKNLLKPKLFIAVTIITFLSYSCDNDDDNEIINEANSVISLQEEEGLLFMLEEEKLARDTYNYLYNVWGSNVFNNIKSSEQTHMNTVSNLLDQNNISYTILPEGQFEDESLQLLFNQFVEDGQVSVLSAYNIGALIEDLDISDLEEFINETNNEDIVIAYNLLECGSRNHLRSFVTNITDNDGQYLPQFLSLENFNDIINGSHENCNQ